MTFTVAFKRPIAIGILCLGAFPLSAGALSFTITDLGALDDPFGSSEARGISSNGLVTGRSPRSGSDQRAFLYDGSTMTDLGTLGTFNDPNAGLISRSLGVDVNSSGHVVGRSSSADRAGTAFFYDGTTMHDLGVLGVYVDTDGSLTGIPGSVISDRSFAFGINDAGSVVGSSSTDSAKRHAFLYDGTTMHDLGVLGVTTSGGFVTNDDSRAFDINDSGWVTGFSSIAGVDISTENHAFLYDGTTMIDLGTLAGSGAGFESFESSGEAINNNGWVAGVSDTASGVEHGFLYDGTTMMDLGSLLGAGGDSVAVGLNDLGQVVGWSDSTSFTGRSATLYDTSLGGLLDLNDLIDPLSGWHLQRAWDINNAGQIVGRGFNADGERHAFLLDVVADPIPEPATVTLVGLGLLGLAARARRNKFTA